MADNGCLRCSETASYQYVIAGGGFLCPPCCALLHPDRFLSTANEVALEMALARAERSDEEWEAMGWRSPATVTRIEEATDAPS